MSYIPYYLDGDIQTGIVVFWAAVGVAAVIIGWRRSLPSPHLKRRAAIAAGCACASILLYGWYVLQRQAVEATRHMTFGESQRHRSPQ